MNNIFIIVAVIVVAVMFTLVGYMFGQRRELYWRIKWIELEHDTARKLGKEPRNISEVEP
jgi:hypothetical protein